MKHVTIANLVHEFAQHLNEGKQSELIRGKCAQLEAELVAHLERYVETYSTQYAHGRMQHEDANWRIAIGHMVKHPHLDDMRQPGDVAIRRCTGLVEELRQIDVEEAKKRG